MSIEFAIQPVMHGPGYEVVRTADNAVLATVATAGEASQYIHNLELERRYDAERSGQLYVKPEPPTLPDNPSDALTSILEWIEEHFALPPAEGEITVSHLYSDPRNHNDITNKPVGPLVYTDYALGADDTSVFISLDASGVLQLVSMFGHDPVDIHDALGALANLRALLNDPRVQALRQK